MHPPPLLILASSSPYRRELLARLGLPFQHHSPDIDESRHPGESAEDMVRRLAREKAQAVADAFGPGLVLGSDQCAVRGTEILGKPGDTETAVAQLAAASGKEVIFLTAVCVLDASSGVKREDLDETRVRFRELEENEIRRYLARENALDCAGSFKSEGLGITLFEAIENRDPTALMGLPLIATARILREFGYELP